MPIYDFRCDDCSHEFEGFSQGIIILDTEVHSQVCPNCKSNRIKKIIGGARNLTLKFTGTGFYITDYTDKKNPN